MDFNKYHDKLMESSQIAQNGECRMWTGYRKGNYGVINVKIHSHWRARLVHRVSLFVRDQKIYATHVDSSHLCHNSLCIAPHHLSAEPHTVNNSRQCCRSLAWCSGHGEFADCMLHFQIL